MELVKFDDKAFVIYMHYNKKQVPVTLKNCFCSDTYERFYVYGKNSVITIQNNRPELRRLNKSAHRFQWKMIIGSIDIPEDFLKSLFDAVEDYIQNILEGGYEKRREYLNKKR